MSRSGCHVKPEQIFSLIFGYSDRWTDWLGGTQSGAGNYVAYTTAPGSDEIFVVHVVFIRNTSGARGQAFIEARDGVETYVLNWDAGLARYETMLYSGSLVLKGGDQIRVRMNDCLDGDVISAGAWGYKMTLTQ